MDTVQKSNRDLWVDGFRLWVEARYIWNCFGYLW